MRLLRCIACALLCGLPAQTYSPRQIRFNGGGDPAELLRLSGLQPGKALSKEEIEAAMSKLADTGAFTDLSYTVNADALVITLGGAADAPGQSLPVRYVNFVWWQPEELTKLLQARVPLFHGELPFTGTLTDRVCAVLVQLLAEKGVPEAKVQPMTSTMASSLPPAPGKVPKGVGSIALQITQPDIRLGTLALPGAAPVTEHQLEVVSGKLGMQEFASDLTAQAIRENVADTEKNAGYLDATVDPPAFSAPRKEMNDYTMDATATVHPGDLYRIAALDLGTRAPMTETEAVKAVDLKPGLAAGEMVMRIASGTLQRAYMSHGYLDSLVRMVTTLDHAAHTVALRFTVQEGELYHLAGTDTTALPENLRTAFAQEFTGKPGMEAGAALNTAVANALVAINASRSVRAGLRINHTAHTVVLVLTPAQASAPGSSQNTPPSAPHPPEF